MEKQPWGNTLEVTRGVDEALDLLAPGLEGVEVDPTIFRPATFIEMSLHNLNRALLIGCVLVILLLGIFLYDWRTAVISLLAIPLSLIGAALVLRYQGGVIDTMVLAGLVIALGEVVDDAIIDVENIMRRLRLNAAAGEPEARLQGGVRCLPGGSERRGVRQPHRGHGAGSRSSSLAGSRGPSSVLWPGPMSWPSWPLWPWPSP